MAARFWVGGTGTWDNSDTSHWSSTTGPGNAPQSVPGSADTVTFDANSGGGTVTVNHASNTIQSLTMGTYTGQLDFSVNNNNITLTATGNAFSGTGTATRRLDMGNGTWTLSSAVAPIWDVTTSTNFTLNANGSTIIFSSTTAAAALTFNAGSGLTYNNLTIVGHATIPYLASITAGGATIGTLTIAGYRSVTFVNAAITTVTNLVVSGTVSKPVTLRSSSNTAAGTVAVTTATIGYAAIQLLTFTGSPTANNSFDLGGNSGVTINAPTGGGNSARVIGG